MDSLIKGAKEYTKKGEYLEAIEILTEAWQISEDNEQKKSISNLTEKYREQQEVKDKKKKKSEGVSIGMTQEEVLQSSWGKPKDINKTITKYGVNEQWVYANYNYLYFEDGILVTIQN